MRFTFPLRTSTDNNLLVDGYPMELAVVNEFNTHGLLVSVEQYPGGGRVEHNVEIASVAGRPEESPGRREPRAVSRGGLSYREARMSASVQVHCFVT